MKISQEKLNQVITKLNNLEKDVIAYVAPQDDTKKDKKYLILEESLTQCLLQLEEIDRKDERIN